MVEPIIETAVSRTVNGGCSAMFDESIMDVSATRFVNKLTDCGAGSHFRSYLSSGYLQLINLFQLFFFLLRSKEGYQC